MPYLSPECSGRMGKSADYRSDYYSIGATMFEVFVVRAGFRSRCCEGFDVRSSQGHTPFHDVFDPLEIIHAHIARRPLLASHYDPSIPEPLALIIAKLLEKSPDARYQTSQGLILDLEKVVELVRQRSGATASMFSSMEESFVVGSIDEAAYFRLPPSSRLFGREDSIEELLASYARVERSSRPEIVIIKGQSGIGKSSLVETVRNPVLRSRGCYALVKFGAFFSALPLLCPALTFVLFTRRPDQEPRPFLCHLSSPLQPPSPSPLRVSTATRLLARAPLRRPRQGRADPRRRAPDAREHLRARMAR